MNKTIKEIADELGVSKTAIRNKMNDDFRGKWVQTLTANGVQTLVITEEGINALKSMFKSRNLGENQVETKQVSNGFYEKQIENLQKLLDQSQQLLLNEQKKSQLLIESKSNVPADWEKEKIRLENSIIDYKNSVSQANQRATDNYEYAERTERFFWLAVIVAGVFFVLSIILIWIHFF